VAKENAEEEQVSLKDMRERNKAILFGMVVVLGVLGLALLGSFIIGEPVHRSEIRNVQIKLVGHGWTIDCAMNSTTNNTVYRLLKECAQVKGFDVEGTIWEPYEAVFVDSINGLDNNDGRFWQYYVNDKYGEISSDRRGLSNGDQVEWRWEDPQI
jgi:hypothetical protein